MQSFYSKYYKYKLKYLNLKSQLGGSLSINNIKDITKQISIPRQIGSKNLQLVKEIVFSKLKKLFLILR